MNSNKSLEEATIEEEKRLSKRGKIADGSSGLTYSFIVGGMLDFLAGLRFPGIMYSRLSSVVTDSLTSIPYGMWRDKVFKTAKTTEKSGKIKKYITDLVAFNTFQIPVYAAIVSFASYLSDGYIDGEKVRHGVTYLAAISPLIAPTRGLYMDGVRKLFGAKSSLEKANVSKKTEDKKNL